MKKYISIISAILLLSIIIIVTYKVCHINKKEYDNKEEKKKIENLTDKQKIERILELEDSSLKIVKFDEVINEGDYYEGIEAEITVNNEEFQKIEVLLKEKYRLFLESYSDYFNEEGYVGYGTEVSKKNLNNIADNKIVREYFGDRYDDFFENEFFKMSLDVDLEAFNSFIDGNIKDKDNLLYAICETYSNQFELIKKFCNKVGVTNYEVRNDYELYNRIGEHIYEDTYSRENHLYYWKDDNDRYHIYIDYRESTTKMVIS